MNIKYLEMVTREKVCPVCSVGMTREVGRRIYQCDHSRCGERFDLSHLTDQMIGDLLKKTADGKPEEAARNKRERGSLGQKKIRGGEA